MEQSYVDLVALLRSFVQGGPPQLSEQPDWDKIRELAQIHSVGGIAGSVLMSNPGLGDEQLRAALRRQCLAEIGIYTRRADRMRDMIRVMNEQGIDHLLFKGFVVRDYYPVPELRSFGDIDFIIRREDRKRTHELMLKLGFECTCEYEPALAYLRGNEYYEIHTGVLEVDVSDKMDYIGYYERIWDHAVCLQNHTYVFTPEFHFLYLLTHIAKHISSSGAGIRMYLDIAFFVRHFGDSLDWAWVQTELKTLQFTDYANMVLQAVEQWFGVPSPIPLHNVDQEILDDFLTFTLEGGTFGQFGRDAGTIFVKNQNRNDTRAISHGATVRHRLFPPAKELENRYTYLQGRHWLLPAAWIHRFFRGAERFEYHVHQARDILDADDEKVFKLRRIYKEIGL